MNISVIGPGRWGTFIGWYLSKIGFDVLLYGRETSKDFIQLKTERKNNLLTLNDSIELSSDIEYTLNRADIIVISIGAQNLRDLFTQISQYDIAGKTFVLCMKGIEEETGKRLTEIVKEFTDAKVAIWVGPGHVQDFVNGKPNCMIIDSEDRDTVHRLTELFSSELIRLYYGNDLIGNEIGAATKNVIGIGSGILDGLDYSSLKGALTSRGTYEISKLIEAMGGNKLSAYGLGHLGDYGATVFSNFSHNRAFGEKFVKGEEYDKLAEGYYTVKAIELLSQKYNVEMPICHCIYRTLYENVPAKEAIADLFKRPTKHEFEF